MTKHAYVAATPLYGREGEHWRPACTCGWTSPREHGDYLSEEMAWWVWGRHVENAA